MLMWTTKIFPPYVELIIFNFQFCRANLYKWSVMGPLLYCGVGSTKWQVGSTKWALLFSNWALLAHYHIYNSYSWKFFFLTLNRAIIVRSFLGKTSWSLLVYIIYSGASTISLSFWLSWFLNMVSETNVTRGYEFESQLSLKFKWNISH